MDIYSEFGVKSAVYGGVSQEEHEQAMIALPTDVRSGDDRIVTEPVEDPKEETEEVQGETQEDPQEETEEVQGESEDPQEGAEEFTPLGDPTEDLKNASAAVDEYAEGLAQMRAQAIKQGLSEEVAQRIEVEYETDGKLSEETYAALEAVGYTRGFVRSFISGQEAIADSYVAQIQAYAGGKEKMGKIVSHMRANTPDALEALNAAIHRQDLSSVKAIIILGMQSHAKKFGKTPERSVNRRASAPQGPSKKTEGFASQVEMVKAMSDRRYSLDPEYRKSVEARVIASQF